MLVSDRMKQPVLTITPDMPIHEALDIMRREKIRHLPVLRDGILVGLVTNEDLFYASPSPATALSIWDMNYLISKITVKDVMSENVITVADNTPIEEAALSMAEHKIGCVPVMRGNELVGIITETDLLKILPELLAVHQTGIRVTVLIREEPGQLAKITKIIADHGGNFISFVQFAGEDQDHRLVTVKIYGMLIEDIRNLLEPIVVKVVDIRNN